MKIEVSAKYCENFRWGLLSAYYWWSGSANVFTYKIDELMATKLKALYQRRKGRDLFDMWYVVNKNLINLSRVFQIFAKYCAHEEVSFSRKEFIQNLEIKKEHPAFRQDMDALLPESTNWNFNEAYQFVLSNIVDNMPRGEHIDLAHIN